MIQNPDISGALFDFVGFLTAREKAIILGASNSSALGLELLEEWANMRGLSLDKANVEEWNDWDPAINKGE